MQQSFLIILHKKIKKIDNNLNLVTLVVGRGNGSSSEVQEIGGDDGHSVPVYTCQRMKHVSRGYVASVVHAVEDAS